MQCLRGAIACVPNLKGNSPLWKAPGAFESGAAQVEERRSIFMPAKHSHPVRCRNAAYKLGRREYQCVLRLYQHANSAVLN